MIYPNPFNNQLTVVSEKADRFELYSLSGFVVRSEAISKAKGITKINVSALKSGVYILRLYSGGEHYDHKLVKY